MKLDFSQSKDKLKDEHKIIKNRERIFLYEFFLFVFFFKEERWVKHSEMVN